MITTARRRGRTAQSYFVSCRRDTSNADVGDRVTETSATGFTVSVAVLFTPLKVGRDRHQTVAETDEVVIGE